MFTSVLHLSLTIVSVPTHLKASSFSSPLLQENYHSNSNAALISFASFSQKDLSSKLGQREHIGLNPFFVCLNVHLLWLVRFLAVRDKIQFWFILNLTIRRMRRAVCV